MIRFNIILVFLILNLLQCTVRTASLSTSVLHNKPRKVRKTPLRSSKQTTGIGTQALSEAAKSRYIRFVSRERLIDKIFDEADTNHDGSVDFDEVYELVLKILIAVNRKVPIPPPSRQHAMKLFINADRTHNNKLSREEFRGLANLMIRRLVLRVIAHKLVTVVGAPVLTELVLRASIGIDWLPKLATNLVPKPWEKRLLPVLLSSTFWRTVLLVIFVSTLGNLVIETFNWVLDKSQDDNDQSSK